MPQTDSPAANPQDAPPPTIEDVEASVRRQLKWQKSRSRMSTVFSPALAGVAMLLVWEFGARALAVPAFLLPTPSIILASLAAHSSLLLVDSWVTITEFILGFVLSVIVGVPLALGIFLWPPFSRAVYPLLVSSQAVPKIAVAPLFIVWFGFGLLPKVLISFLIAFFPVVISTAVGLASIEAEKIYLARSIGFGPIKTFFKIRLPSALPSIFGGLKISVTLAVIGAIVGEFVGGSAGLGYLLMVANGSMDTPLLFAGITVLTILCVAFFLLIELIEYLVIPRRSHAQKSRAGETM